jgi:hypothetical protein
VTSLEGILLAKNERLCRVSVQSCHLLNYSHSVRHRSALTSRVNVQYPLMHSSLSNVQSTTDPNDRSQSNDCYSNPYSKSARTTENTRHCLSIGAQQQNSTANGQCDLSAMLPNTTQIFDGTDSNVPTESTLNSLNTARQDIGRSLVSDRIHCGHVEFDTGLNASQCQYTQRLDEQSTNNESIEQQSQLNDDDSPCSRT